jgi:hypothetical protein
MLTRFEIGENQYQYHRDDIRAAGITLDISGPDARGVRHRTIPGLACHLVGARRRAQGAPDEPRKVSVVSFGLFGDQRVFQSEATGAAQVVANRWGRASDRQVQHEKGRRRHHHLACRNIASDGKKHG